MEALERRTFTATQLEFMAEDEYITIIPTQRLERVEFVRVRSSRDSQCDKATTRSHAASISSVSCTIRRRRWDRSAQECRPMYRCGTPSCSRSATSARYSPRCGSMSVRSNRLRDHDLSIHQLTQFDRSINQSIRVVAPEDTRRDGLGDRSDTESIPADAVPLHGDRAAALGVVGAHNTSSCIHECGCSVDC